MNIVGTLTLMTENGASDTHFTAGNPPAFRINGKLAIATDMGPLSNDELWHELEQLLDEGQMKTFVETRELDFALDVASSRFRGNAALERGKVTLVFRRITELTLDFEQLGLPDLCGDLAMKPRGLVIATGTVGSGKSTTLAAMIGYLNRNTHRRIVTMEDPIEYIFNNERSLITQRQVGSDTLSFPGALSHVLRQNPDVIMVGEARDDITMGAALTASETGHLVLTTAHAPGAPQTIDRIIDLFQPHHQSQIRSQLAAILEAVLYQQLLPRADGKGRVLAVEIMLGTPAIRNLIREGKTHQLYSSIQLGSSLGMQTLDQSLLQLFRRGVVTAETVMAVCQNREQMGKDLKASSPSALGKVAA